MIDMTSDNHCLFTEESAPQAQSRRRFDETEWKGRDPEVLTTPSLSSEARSTAPRQVS